MAFTAGKAVGTAAADAQKQSGRCDLLILRPLAFVRFDFNPEGSWRRSLLELIL